MSDTTLKQLRKEAEDLGLTVHHRANEETIQNLINAELAKRFRNQEVEAAEEVEAATDEIEQDVPVEAPVRPSHKIRAKTAAEIRQDLIAQRRNKAAALVRIRVQCMDPNKREYEGDVFSAGNAKIGSFKKYIPFNGVDWHAPRIIVDVLKGKKCSQHRNVPDGQGGYRRESFLTNAYSVEELPPLTPEELQELARKQAMSAGTGR